MGEAGSSESPAVFEKCKWSHSFFFKWLQSHKARGGPESLMFKLFSHVFYIAMETLIRDPTIAIYDLGMLRWYPWALKNETLDAFFKIWDVIYYHTCNHQSDLHLICTGNLIVTFWSTEGSSGLSLDPKMEVLFIWQEGPSGLLWLVTFHICPCPGHISW